MATTRCEKLVYNGEPFLECVEGGGRIDIYEAAYLQRKNRVEIIGSDGAPLDWISLIIEASRNEPRSWVMFTVYHDLRERGRVLKLGPLPNAFTLYKTGAPRALVIVLEETYKFRVDEIIEWIEYARRLSRELILAIVDKHGDVSYYTVERFQPPSQTPLPAVAPVHGA